MDLGVSIAAIENRREIVCGKRRERVEKMDVLLIFQTERESACTRMHARSGAQKQASFRGIDTSSAVGSVERACVPLW